MSIVPKSVTRLGGRTILQMRAASPTFLVVAGVVGLGATAVLAAKASRNMDPILDEHKKARAEVGYVGQNRDRQKDLALVYLHTSVELGKLYGPTIFVGTTSAIAVLGGHKILRTRHIATMAAYSGLAEQFQAYRGRVAKTLGEDVERGIFEGAHGEWVEDPDHKGEYKLQPKFDKEGQTASYLRPWFDETNPNWTSDPEANRMFLTGVQSHLNNMLQIRGHVFLMEVYDALRIPRVPECAIAGWVWRSGKGDDYVDLGFMTSIDPNTIAFNEGYEPRVQLNFNVDKGPMWNLIGRNNRY